MNKKKALLIGLVLVIVLLVGVLVGVLAGGGSKGGDPTPAAPSAPSTPVNTSMDDVVGGHPLPSHLRRRHPSHG